MTVKVKSGGHEGCSLEEELSRCADGWKLLFVYMWSMWEVRTRSRMSPKFLLVPFTQVETSELERFDWGGGLGDGCWRGSRVSFLSVVSLKWL